MNEYSPRILWIENEIPVTSAHSPWLEGLNGYVIEQRSFKELEQAYAGEMTQYSAILMDGDMPVEHQLAFLRQLQAVAPALPVIVLAQEGNSSQASEILDAGAQDYLLKPWIHKENLSLCIKNAIERQHFRTKLLNKMLEDQRNQQNFRTLIEKNADSILIVDDKGHIQFANPAAEHLFDTNASELIGVDFGFPILMGDTIEIDIWHRGHPRYAEMRVVDIIWQGQNVFLVSLRDVTERVQTEKRMRHLATHDALTNLPNRMLFFDRLNHAIAHAARQQTRVAVFFLDVDKFKDVNDTFGHQTGDQILQALAFRLQECLRKSDTVARMGGDEFTIILENLESPEQCIPIAKKILEVVQTSFSIQKQNFHLTASLGISIFPEDGKDVDVLLTNADTAMYLSKENRNQFRFYNSAFNV